MYTYGGRYGICLLGGGVVWAGSDLGINWFCVVQFALGELYNAKQCISAIRGFSG